MSQRIFKSVLYSSRRYRGHKNKLPVTKGCKTIGYQLTVQKKFTNLKKEVSATHILYEVYYPNIQ